MAGAYVIAVEKGEYRELEPKEEAEFQDLMYSPERKRAGTVLDWPMKQSPEPID